MNYSPQDSVRRDLSESFQETSGLALLKGRKLYITGGTGFMGTWLLEALAWLNDTAVFGVSAAVISRNASEFKARHPHLASRKEFSFADRDAKDIIEIPGDVSYIVHAAGSPDNRFHSSDPMRAMGAISKGAEAVLEAAVRLPDLVKVLHISSGLVYGPQPMDLERIPETYPGGPDCSSITSVYAEAKRYAETLVAAYRSQYKLPVAVARPFAFIGPYQFLDKPWAVNNFINDAMRGGPIGILGDENTVRSYMYPSDMVHWLLTMLAAPGALGTYNLGSPEAVTLLSLAKKVSANFTPAPEIITAKPGQKRHGVSRFAPDVSVVQKNLGLKVRIGLDESIRRTLLWNKAFKA